MNPIPNVELRPPPDDSPPWLWSEYIHSVLILILAGVMIYQQAQLSNIHGMLEMRTEMFRALSVDNATIVSNQQNILKQLEAHEQDAIRRDVEIQKQIQQVLDGEHHAQ